MLKNRITNLKEPNERILELEPAKTGWEIKISIRNIRNA
jgi:hypothetical protein